MLHRTEQTISQTLPPAPAKVRPADAAPTFAPGTVGALIHGRPTVLDADLTVAQAVDALREEIDRDQRMYYVYVVDAERRLLGVLSMRDLILADEARLLRSLMRRRITTIRANADQEEAARVVARTGFLALPVVDEAGHLLGLATADDLVGVIEAEATEDVQVMFGAGAGERLDTPWQTSVRQRLPWLLVNLLLASIAAAVIGLFEATVAAISVVAIYMPIVAGMGGNATAQAMSVAIRGIAVGEADTVRLRRVALRQVTVGLLAGALSGVIAGVVAILFHHEHGVRLGVIVAIAMTVNLAIGCLWGLTVPFLMRRLGFDPAQSATIFTTTMTDLVGFLLILAMASRWMA